MNWNLDSIFPSVTSVPYLEYVEAVGLDAKSLVDATSELASTCRARELVEPIETLEDVQARLRHVMSYVGCVCAADVRDQDAQSARARVYALGAQLSKAWTTLSGQVSRLDDDQFSDLVSALPDAEGALHRMREEGGFLMDGAREGLAEDLGVDGFHAWGRLYQKVSGALRFPMRQEDGSVVEIPMSQRRTLMEDEDPAVRRAAFEGGNTAWRSIAPVAASALNAITGTRLTLLRERGYGDVLSLACKDSRIARRTLDAMMEVVEGEGAELARRYVRLKARRAGVEGLGFYELAAPLTGARTARVSWTDARESVIRAFDKAWPELGDYTRLAFDNLWIEAEPRDGKSPGGFCSSSPVSGESRIFMTFRGTAGDVQTLAHELGHAFHGHVMRDMRPLARSYPMTLAESASTFAEQAYTQVLLDSPDTEEAEQLALLNTRLAKAAAFLLDIPVRFRFEKALHDERLAGELSEARLCEMMSATQREVLGDVGDESGLDPLFWASKLHYYITHVAFYNFPYTFGYLFSMHLWERFAGAGKDGREQHTRLLRATGAHTAEQVAREHLGVDLGDPAFWSDCLAPVRRDVERLEAMSGP